MLRRTAYPLARRAFAVSLVPAAFLSRPTSMQLRHVAISPALRASALWDPTSFFFDDYAGPKVHAYEAASELNLEMEVPRYQQGDLKVTGDPATGRLTIVGQRQPPPRSDEFHRLLFADTASTHFKRMLRVSPEYDLSKLTQSLEHGVLHIKIPRHAEEIPENVKVEGEAQQASDAAALTAAQPAALQRAMANMSWPPKVKVDDTATDLTYSCEMPAELPKENVSLQLQGRSLVLSVHYNMHTKTRYGEETRSGTYSTTLQVPKGTKAADVHTHFDKGVLKISLKKIEAAAPNTVKVDAA